MVFEGTGMIPISLLSPQAPGLPMCLNAAYEVEIVWLSQEFHKAVSCK